MTFLPDDQNDDEIQEIPLPNVKTRALAKVIEYAEHYKIDPMNEIAKVRIFAALSNQHLMNFRSPSNLPR